MNKMETAHYLANRYPEKLIILFQCSHDGEKQKHHPSYEKPFEVELLCPKCHGARRRGNKTSFSCLRYTGGLTSKMTNCAFFSVVNLEACEGCPQKGAYKIPAKQRKYLLSPQVLRLWGVDPLLTR